MKGDIPFWDTWLGLNNMFYLHVFGGLFNERNKIMEYG